MVTDVPQSLLGSAAQSFIGVVSAAQSLLGTSAQSFEAPPSWATSPQSFEAPQSSPPAAGAAAGTLTWSPH